MTATDTSILEVPTKAGAYLPTLDGWRAVAIALVIVQHIAPSLRAVHGPGVTAWGERFFQQGYTGVEIFFGISGFLICTRLLQEHRWRGAIALRRFYLRRAHRILPAAMLYLAAIGLLGLGGVITLRLRDWLAAVFFAANYPPGVGWYVAHFWSLAMEEHFYLLFPPLLALAGPRKTLWIAIAMACAAAGWRAIDVTLQLSADALSPPWNRTDAACDGLLWGCVAALLYDRPASRAWMTRWLASPVFVVLLVTFVALAARLPESLTPGLWRTTAMMLLVSPLLLTTVTHPASLFARILEWPPLRWIGRISYGLYLWQQLFLPSSGARSPLMWRLQDWPMNLVCVFFFAAASYYFIERPLIRRGHRMTRSD